jgi:pimeloyl-ACP methyl ester carboxylesterase
MSSTAGELVTEVLEYDGGRQVTAYVPAAAPQAIVFAGDGQLIMSWGAALEAADLPPTMIIGAHRLADETLRLHEYSPGRGTDAFAFDPQRFAAHEKFFVEDVRRWAATRLGTKLPADRTAAFGVSASAELALAMGLRHTDIYGAVFCASPGAGYQPRPAGSHAPTSSPAPTNRSSATTRPGGRTRCVMRVAMLSLTERVGSHGDAFWKQEFPLMVAWAFGH